MMLWRGEGELEIPAPDGIGYLRFVLRFVGLALVIFPLMIPMFLARFLGLKTLSEAVVTLACKLCLRVVGIRLETCGTPMQHPGAVVANHASWLDIFTLNAVQRAYFVSKAEVSNWPLIGFIARSTGVVFIERRAADAARQKDIFLSRISAGDKLLFFPEGTSTDGLRVLKFRSSLFAAFFEPGLRETMWIQPVAVIYHAPKGADSRFYGWWGEMDFVPHFMHILGSRRQGRVTIQFADPIRVSDMPNRKVLADKCEKSVRAAMETSQSVSG